MATTLRVRRSFSTLTDQLLIALVGAVISGLNNSVFAKPPVEATTLQDELDQFTASIANLSSGDPKATAARNSKREALVASLRQLATFVEIKSANDLTTLLSSGFSAMTVSRSQSPLSRPSITTIDNGHTTQLVVRVTGVPKAKSYEVRCAPLGQGGVVGAWQPGGIFTSSRSMRVNGLVPGTIYTFQVRAIGGSTGSSDWSDPVTHMCM